MAYKQEKGGDLVINGFTSIAPSPHQGIGNLQNVNIGTEPGEVMTNFSRVQESQTGNTSANLNATELDSSHLSTSVKLLNGQWITISDAGTTGISTGNYYIQNSVGSATTSASSFQISTTYNGSVSSGFSAGTITFNLLRVMSLPVASATEEYTDSNNLVHYRYYVLDVAGMLWVYDTGLVNSQTQGKLYWFLPDITNPDGLATLATGLAVYNGWVHVFKGSSIWVKCTSLLGTNGTSGSVGYTQFPYSLQTPPFNLNPHFATVLQGEIIYTDSNFVGTILALSNSGAPTNPNLFLYCSVGHDGSGNFTFTGISGQLPIVNQTVMFITQGTLPTGLTAGTLYYVYSVDKSILGSTGVVKFTVGTGVGSGQVTSLSGGSGAVYVNSYNPAYSNGKPTYAFSGTALLLPSSEVATSIAQLGTSVVIGGISATMYIWDLVAKQPTGFIFLPEANVANLLTVNVVVYACVGNKGNIYVTNGSSVSLAFTVPDYTAGIAGAPTSYYDPYFKWGGMAILRGRVFVSIQDQTATKAGNCGGIWSFVPSFFNPVTGADAGIQLRLENTNSYGTLNGMATIILPLANQAGITPQYFTAWASDQSSASATYGIDATGTLPSTTAIIESDLIPTGTMLDKRTFSQVEYKVASPLLSGESIALYYRQNATDSWVSCGTLQEETAAVPTSQSRLSGLYPVSFEVGQWLQIQARLIPTGSTTFSGNRMTEIRLR